MKFRKIAAIGAVTFSSVAIGGLLQTGVVNAYPPSTPPWNTMPPSSTTPSSSTTSPSATTTSVMSTTSTTITPGGSKLPETGSNSTNSLQIGGVVLVSGVGLAAVARRRRQSRPA